MDDEILAAAQRVSREMETDGTWSELRRQVQEQFPDRQHEHRFMCVADGPGDLLFAPAVWLRKEPWTEDAAVNWMEYLWELHRVKGTSLKAICDLADGRLFRGKLERVPTEAAQIYLQRFMDEMAPGVVQVGEVSEVHPDQPAEDTAAAQDEQDAADVWVRENWPTVAAASWEYYRRFGRGAVIPAGSVLNYVTEGNFRDRMEESVKLGGDSETAEQALRFFRDYDPKRQVLMLIPSEEWVPGVDLGGGRTPLFPEHSGAALDLRLFEHEPCPPQACAENQRQG